MIKLRLTWYSSVTGKNILFPGMIGINRLLYTQSGGEGNFLQCVLPIVQPSVKVLLSV